MAVHRYSVSDLRKLRFKDCCGLPRKLKRMLFILKIRNVHHLYVCSRSRPIPVLLRRRQGDKPNHRHSPTQVSTSSRTLRPLRRLDRHGLSSRKPLRFGLLNIRSIHHKADEARELFSDYRINVLFLTETWHDKESTSLGRLRADGFQVVDRPRPRTTAETLSTNHGGVAAVANAGIRLTALSIGFPISSCESLCMRISCGSASCIAVLIYRTGPVSLAFFDELSNIIDSFVSHAEPLFIVGDFNIHVERQDDPSATRLLDTFTSRGLQCHVHDPTHDHGGILDLIFSRRDLPSPRVRLEDPGLSDHRLLLWSAALTRPPPIYTNVTYRPWSQLDVNAFRRSLSNSILCDPSQWLLHSCDDLALLYDSTINAILNSTIPFRTIRCCSRPSDPWYDDECRAAKRKLRTLERRIRTSGSQSRLDIQSLTTEQKEIRRAYRLLLKRKRESFWLSKVESEHSNPRQLWRSLNSLLGRGKSQSSDAFTAADFMAFFTRRLTSLHETLINPESQTFSCIPPNCKFSSFSSVHNHEVVRGIRSLPVKQSSCDPLPTRLLKECCDLISPFISFLFNKSLALGLMPAKWKVARITPTLKKGKRDTEELSHYRPISNLPVLSKLLERIVAKQLLSHLRTFDLIPSLQSAYREHHSTSTALLKMTTDILTSMDNGEATLFCSLDLSSAFDAVDHSVLLHRLTESFGVCGTAHNWLTSFLSNRSQFVSYRGASSPRVINPIGVPQGSVLGPILFLLYTKDIIPLVLSHDLQVHMFADDIFIYGSCTTDSTTALICKISACIEALGHWLTSNRLVLNTSKTMFMWCATKERLRKVPQDPIVIGGHVSKPVSSLRCLGVVLDSTLSFSPHITKTSSTCFNALRNIRSIRRSVTSSALSSLITAFVFSRLEYCAPVLCGISEHELSRLQSIINASVRVMLFLPRSAHTSKPLAALRWLSARPRIQLHTVTTVFKCLQELAPNYLENMFTRVSDLPGRSRLRSASSASLSLPRLRLRSVSKRSFLCVGARIWNQLPPHISATTNLKLFKRAAMQHFTAKTL